MIELRPYQRKAVDSACEKLNFVDRSTLLVMPTGCGKTVTFAQILDARKHLGRSLVVAHREELIFQAKETIERTTSLLCEIEMADDVARVHGDLYGASNVVIGSVQTLKGTRLGRWPRDAFATIVIDEAHHAAARSYRAITDHFTGARVLGVTATPDRGDHVGLGAVFDSVAFQYGIRDAIRDGYLCAVKQLRIECADLDLSDVKSVRGDLSESDLQQALSIDAVLHQVAAPLAKEAGSRPTLVFTAGVEQAKSLAQVLAGYVGSGKVETIDGKTPRDRRREILDAYQQGQIQFLLNCAVLTEGFDAPHTACVAMARPTKSRALYAQCLGRGLRIHTSKIDCLAIDFVGNAGKHSLVEPLDVLAGRPIPDDVRERARKKAEQGIDVDAALEQAEEEAREQQRREEEERRRRHVRAQVAYTRREVNPFDVFGMPVNGTGPRATDGQLRALAKFGVELEPKVISARDASALLDKLGSRARSGLATYKQARLLSRYGLPADLTRQQASEAIDAIANNGWRVPRALAEKYGNEAAE